MKVEFFNRGDFTGIRIFILFILLGLRRALSCFGKLIIAQLKSGFEIPSSAATSTEREEEGEKMRELVIGFLNWEDSDSDVAKLYSL